MLRVLTLMVGGALVASAQPPIISPADTAERTVVAGLLTSPAPDKLAWGAYLAANYQQKSFIPAIIPLLTHQDPDVRLVAIDSLIRLDADVPEQDLLAFMGGGETDPVLILLSRRPKAHTDLLMRLLDSSRDRDWIVVNSMLFDSRPPGYAARLLRDWTIRITVNVRDDNSVSGGARGMSGTIADGAPYYRPGFPPFLFYRIYEGVLRDFTVLAAGPHPVSYVRRESPSSAFPTINRDNYRWDYLNELAGPTASKLPYAFQRFQWAGTAKFQDDARVLLTSLRFFLSELRQGLVKRGNLTEQESQINPKLEIAVIEERADRTEPLPQIDWRLDP